MIDLEWNEFKSYVASKELSIQYVETGDYYSLWAIDSTFMVRCTINKLTQLTEVDDFEDSYKSNANKPLWQMDTDGAQIVRIKAARKGWTYASIPIEFKTAEVGSLWSKTIDGVPRPGITLKFYNTSGDEITTEGLLEVNETTIIRSVVDFEPHYDYEVIGGTLRIATDIAFDCRLWIIAAPDIPAEYGGSKEMAGGINLKFLAPQQVMEVDGRVSKTLIYSATLHTNKLRFIFEHVAGTKTDIHINIELFRQ